MSHDDTHLLSIGRFAELTWLTPRMLRHYDRIGLLHPAVHDSETGYRYYHPGQIETAELIRLLRDLDVPLSDIGAICHDADRDAQRDALRRQRARMRERRAETERVLARIDRALKGDGGLMPYEVGLVDMKPRLVLSSRAKTSLQDLDAVFARLQEELTEKARAYDSLSEEREVVLYYDGMWYGALCDMEVCLPLAGRRAAKVPGAWELAGGPAARVLHSGPWSDIRSAYVALFAWVVDNGYEDTGPIREAYLVDERDSDDPSAFVTSLTWPISRPS